jgi:hypothetical protein
VGKSQSPLSHSKNHKEEASEHNSPESSKDLNLNQLLEKTQASAGKVEDSIENKNRTKITS